MSLSLQAERFDGLVHSFMEQLAEAERVLKCGLISEEEQSLLAFSKQHKVSMDDTLSLAIGKDFFFYPLCFLLGRSKVRVEYTTTNCD